MMVSKRLSVWFLTTILAAAIVWPAVGHAQSAAIDPEALRLLRRSTDYVAGLKQFRVDTHSSIEVVLENGQKLQLDHAAVLTVRRPNKLRAERVGELVDQVFIYDGKSLTVSLPKDGYHATVPAPATIDDMLDFARDRFDLIAPGADLIYANAYDRLTDKLTSAVVVGDAVSAGVRCDHLAFRNDEVDWQICIQQGDKPLPRKYVVTSKKMPQSPSFTVVMSRWDSAVKATDAMFRFVPGKGSRGMELKTAATAAAK